MSTKNMKVPPQHSGAMLLAVLVIVMSGTSLANYFIAIAGFRELPFAQQMLLERLNWVEVGLTFFFHIAIFTGGIWLFLLRKAALHSFLSAFGAGIARLLWTTFSGDTFVTGLGKELIFVGLVLALCVYTWRLNRSGALS